MNSEMFSHGNIWAFLWPQSAHLSGCHKSRQHVRGFIGVMNYGYGPGCALFIIYIFFPAAIKPQIILEKWEGDRISQDSFIIG